MQDQVLPQRDQPVNGVVSGTPQSMSITERDLRLSDLALTVQALLVEAMRAHALGAIDNVPFAAFPHHVQDAIRDAAQAVVMEQSSDRAQLADVAMRASMRRQMEAEAVTLTHSVGILAGAGEKHIVASALKRFIDMICDPFMSIVAKDARDSYRHSLCRPDWRSGRAQVARAALSMITADSASAARASARCVKCDSVLWTAIERTSGRCNVCIEEFKARAPLAAQLEDADGAL